MPDIHGKPLRIDQLVTVLQPDPDDRYHALNGQSGIIVLVYPWGNDGMAVVLLNGRNHETCYLLLDGCELEIRQTPNYKTKPG